MYKGGARTNLDTPFNTCSTLSDLHHQKPHRAFILSTRYRPYNPSSPQETRSTRAPITESLKSERTTTMLLAPKTPLFYLFTICVLVSLTAAAPSTNQFRRRNSIAPNSTIISPIQKRQTTSREIIHRRNIKKRLEMARQVKEGCKPTQEPQASGKPYPTCYAEGGKVGYARYANWYVSATGLVMRLHS